MENFPYRFKKKRNTERDKENKRTGPNQTVQAMFFIFMIIILFLLCFSPYNLTGIRQMYLFPLTASKFTQLVLERRT